jgi:hypothetical protein
VHKILIASTHIHIDHKSTYVYIQGLLGLVCEPKKTFVSNELWKNRY